MLPRLEVLSAKTLLPSRHPTSGILATYFCNMKVTRYAVT